MQLVEGGEIDLHTGVNRHLGRFQILQTYPGGEGLQVYAFYDDTYTGRKGTAGVNSIVPGRASGGSYRFRANQDREQHWSEWVNHCAVPGCAAVAITVGSWVIDTMGIV
jgi:hypothetical protein